MEGAGSYPFHSLLLSLSDILVFSLSLSLPCDVKLSLGLGLELKGVRFGFVLLLKFHFFLLNLVANRKVAPAVQARDV